MLFKVSGVIKRVKIIQLLNMQISPASCYFYLLKFKYSPQHIDTYRTSKPQCYVAVDSAILLMLLRESFPSKLCGYPT
jgi:hypothetical protein